MKYVEKEREMEGQKETEIESGGRKPLRSQIERGRGRKRKRERERERDEQEKRSDSSRQTRLATPSLPPCFFGHLGHRALTYAHATLSNAFIFPHIRTLHAGAPHSLSLSLSLSLSPLYFNNKYIRVEMHTCELSLGDDVGGYEDARGRRR